MAKVLIIEDHKETIGLLKTVVEICGCEALVALDGEEGVEKAKKEKPGLILMDIMLPKMSGLEVLKRIKGNPETSKIPSVIISVKARDEDILEGMALGAEDYLNKPFDPDELEKIIKKFLSAGR